MKTITCPNCGNTDLSKLEYTETGYERHFAIDRIETDDAEGETYLVLDTNDERFGDEGDSGAYMTCRKCYTELPPQVYRHLLVEYE